MKMRKQIFKHISHNYLSGFKCGTNMDGYHQSNKFNGNACVISRRGFEKASDQVKVIPGLRNLIKLHANLLR